MYVFRTCTTDEVFRFSDLETLRVIIILDVIWFGKIYAEWKGLKDNFIVNDDHASDEEYEEEQGREQVPQMQLKEDEAIGQDDNIVQEKNQTQYNPKAIRAL